MSRVAIFAVAVAVVISLSISGCTAGRGYSRQMSGMTYGGRVAEQRAPRQYVVSQPVQQQYNTTAPSQSAPQMMMATRSAEVRKYLHIGANPVNAKRPTRPNERVFAIADDAYITTRDRNGKTSEGWLRAGEQVFAVPSGDPRYWEAVAIKRCGNPIMNRTSGIAPVWILDPTMQQQPVAQQPIAAQAMIQQPAVLPDPVSSEQVPCVQRKSGWGSVIGGAVGFVGGLLTRNKVAAAILGGGGALIGGYIDGECIDPQDAMVALGWGIAGYGFTKPRAHGDGLPPASAPAPGYGGSAGPFPSNGFGPAPLPPNGPSGFPIN